MQVANAPKSKALVKKSEAIHTNIKWPSVPLLNEAASKKHSRWEVIKCSWLWRHAVDYPKFHILCLFLKAKLAHYLLYTLAGTFKVQDMVVAINLMSKYTPSTHWVWPFCRDDQVCFLVWDAIKGCSAEMTIVGTHLQVVRVLLSLGVHWLESHCPLRV